MVLALFGDVFIYFLDFFGFTKCDSPNFFIRRDV